MMWFVPIRRALRKVGIDLLHARPEVTDLLALHRVDTVIDVGANVGQHGQLLRDWGYKGRIVSFEPQSAPFARLAALAARDGTWDALNFGLGDATTTATINVASDSVFSSLLGRTTALDTFGADARTVNTEQITVRRLEEVFPEVRGAGTSFCLKIDTQGYERPVLIGAGDCLSSFACIQLEASITPLYQGEATFLDIAGLLAERGFSIALLKPFAFDGATKGLLQCDVMFVREGVSRALMSS